MRGIITVGAALLPCASTAAVAADEQPICPDRPAKANSACTVPAGHWQIETGLAGWTLDRSAGERSSLLVLGTTAIKYALSDRVNLELDVTPYVRATGRFVRARESASGFGDVLVRYKHRLTRDDAPVEISFYPYLKLPTAKRTLGNGKLEAGVEFPVSINLGRSAVSLAFDPEVDLLADSDGRGWHPAMVQVVDFNLAASARLSLTAELWGRWNWDPAGTVRQASADGAVAYLLTDDVQLDAGANFGLNRNTPDVELYTGVSMRF